MRPEDLHEFTPKRPFTPYRFCVIAGRAYEVRHPDQVIALRSHVVIGVGGENGVPDRTDHVALLHIVSIRCGGV